MTQTWKTLSIKDKIAIISAIIAFILGWGLSIAGFVITPIGEVADSVLWILGQALIYAASVFGVSSYFNAESVKLRDDMNKHLETIEKMRLEKEKEDERERE